MAMVEEKYVDMKEKISVVYAENNSTQQQQKNRRKMLVISVVVGLCVVLILLVLYFTVVVAAGRLTGPTTTTGQDGSFSSLPAPGSSGRRDNNAPDSDSDASLKRALSLVEEPDTTIPIELTAAANSNTLEDHVELLNTTTLPPKNDDDDDDSKAVKKTFASLTGSVSVPDTFAFGNAEKDGISKRSNLVEQQQPSRMAGVQHPSQCESDQCATEQDDNDNELSSFDDSPTGIDFHTPGTPTEATSNISRPAVHKKRTSTTNQLHQKSFKKRSIRPDASMSTTTYDPADPKNEDIGTFLTSSSFD